MMATRRMELKTGPIVTIGRLDIPDGDLCTCAVTVHWYGFGSFQAKWVDYPTPEEAERVAEELRRELSGVEVPQEYEAIIRRWCDETEEEPT